LRKALGSGTPEFVVAMLPTRNCYAPHAIRKPLFFPFTSLTSLTSLTSGTSSSVLTVTLRQQRAASMCVRGDGACACALHGRAAASACFWCQWLAHGTAHAKSWEHWAQAVDFLSGFALQPGSSCADCAALQSLGSLQYQQRIVHAILKRRLAAAAAALAAVAAHATVIDPVDRVASEQQKALLRRVRRRLF
jgi:hypothetical protein